MADTGALTERSGSITTGGTAQQVAAQNSARRYLLIVNLSTTDVLWVRFGGQASAGGAQCIPLAPSSTDRTAVSLLEYGAGGAGFVPSNAVSVFGATNGSPFVCVEG